MAISQHTTRRALFGGALGLASATGTASLPVIAAPVQSDLTVLMREHRQLWLKINDHDTPSAEGIALCGRLTAIEDSLLVAPIRSRDDIIPKLYAVGITAVHGEREDMADEHCFLQCVRWLEVN